VQPAAYRPPTTYRPAYNTYRSTPAMGTQRSSYGLGGFGGGRAPSGGGRRYYAIGSDVSPLPSDQPASNTPLIVGLGVGGVLLVVLLVVLVVVFARQRNNVNKNIQERV